MCDHAHTSHLLDADNGVVETIQQIVAVLVSTQIPIAPLALWKVPRFGGNQ
jgi:hypothetical protein